jgi:hypothetical protein
MPAGGRHGSTDGTPCLLCKHGKSGFRGIDTMTMAFDIAVYHDGRQRLVAGAVRFRRENRR